MTDQRTLKNIINQQREEIRVIHEKDGEMMLTLENQIADANKIINEYCVGCSRFRNNDCTLKLPKNCYIKQMRVTLQIPAKRRK